MYLSVFTADYGLYWFDYKSNYSSIFAEFVGNQSRERHIALCRGAADAFDRDWSVIVTWKHDQARYLDLAANCTATYLWLIVLEPSTR